MRTPTFDSEFDRLMNHGLQFYYEHGSITPVEQGEVAQWRVLPHANIAHISGGEWVVEFGDRPAKFIHSGEVLCIAAGVRHRSVMLSEGTSYSTWAHFNILLFGYIDLFWFFELPEVFQGDTAKRLGEIVATLAQQTSDDDPFTFVLNRKILEFEFAAMLISNSTPKYRGDWRLQQIRRVFPVLKILHKDLAGQHTRESLAAAVHLSPSRFAAIFKEALGIAPIDYMVKLRMQRAQQLLLDKTLSIEEIATAIGYQDPFYFSRLFKFHFGSSPRAYRRDLLKF